MIPHNISLNFLSCAESIFNTNYRHHLSVDYFGLFLEMFIFVESQKAVISCNFYQLRVWFHFHSTMRIIV